jgi:hypothetical protein
MENSGDSEIEFDRYQITNREYRWSLYEYRTDKSGLYAVYRHESGAWLSLRPGTSKDRHEIQVFTESGGDPENRMMADARSLIFLLEKNFQIRLRKELQKGKAKEAYNFALIS